MLELDQSFTANNFYSILLYENRKGENIEKKYFENDTYIKYTLKISKINSKLRASLKTFIKNDALKRRTPSKEVFIRYKKSLRFSKRKLKKEKEDALLEILREIGSKIQDKNFSFNLSTGTFNSKTVYKLGNSPEEFFAIKQLQYNFRKLYQIKQANRFEIVNQLKNIFEDNFPKYIIKTDIKSFFESIPNDKIASQLQKDNLLSPKSKELIKKIIKQFESIANPDDRKGIPRGIGISAYLAEYYMRKVDDKIKNLPDVLYYARYVDDIIIVFIPKSENNFHDFFSEIQNVIEKEYSLFTNKKKTQIIIQQKNGFTEKTLEKETVIINYLGYSFILSKDKKLQISITDDKLIKYKNKIKLSFKEYSKYKNKRKAYQHLRDRLKFLTQNYRLHNNKSLILSGIYFSNMLCSDTKFLNDLDKYMKCYLTRYVKIDYHNKKLSEFSFQNGFDRIAYAKFTSNQIKNIIRIWKNV